MHIFISELDTYEKSFAYNKRSFIFFPLHDNERENLLCMAFTSHIKVMFCTLKNINW